MTIVPIVLVCCILAWGVFELLKRRRRPFELQIGRFYVKRKEDGLLLSTKVKIGNNPNYLNLAISAYWANDVRFLLHFPTLNAAKRYLRIDSYLEDYTTRTTSFQVIEIKKSVVQGHIGGDVVAHSEDEAGAAEGQFQRGVNFGLNLRLGAERQRAAVHF